MVCAGLYLSLQLYTEAVLNGIAVDPLSRLIFYTDPGNDLIGLITIATFEHKVLVNRNLDLPSAIVLDTLSG